MNHKLLATVIAGLGLFVLLLPVVGAQGGGAGPMPQQEELTPREAARRDAERLAQEATQKVRSFTAYADGYFEKASKSPVLGWGAAAGGALVGALALFFGWTLVQSLLVPSAPVLGLATGGFLAFCIIEALYTQRPVWFKLTLLSVGGAMGIGLYLFSALRAKPVAAFLVIISPFLILAGFLFPFNAALGLVFFCAGFLAGFLAMVEVRPLSIVATSMFGSCALLGVWGLLSHLIGEDVAFVQDSFQWLTDNPTMLLIGWAALALIGIIIQFATGPRGSLEG